jgi:hypothetical protein
MGKRMEGSKERGEVVLWDSLIPGMADRVPGGAKLIHPYAWLWEPLESEPSFLLRSMFGTKAAYLDGKLVFCFAARREPWRGVLVGTEREHHESLVAEFPDLSPHPVLPKWLYLPDSLDAFDRLAERLVALARARDPRIGVVPKGKRQKPKGPARRNPRAFGGPGG